VQIILLSGGSGKRLWPLSNEVRSKQFIRIFKEEDGTLKSMVERMYSSLKCVCKDADITIATGKSQVSAILNQLDDKVEVCVEPSRRDTFPAIALTCEYLKTVKGVSLDEAVVVCPVDPFVKDDYFECVKKIGEKAWGQKEGLVLMGIKPTYPSEKYGYIRQDSFGKVTGFKEKPDLETAKALLEQNALWNGGVFGFRLGYMIDKAHELIDYTDFYDLKAKYDSLEKKSIDYAVVEKEKNITVEEFAGNWMDVGTWKTLTDVVKDNAIGNVTFDNTCENTHVINETDVPILAMGLKDVVIAASADGILIADKHQSSYMKPLVDKIQSPVMFAEKSWGSYKVLDIGDESMTIKVTLNPGHLMNYHSHERRDEVWTITKGQGIAVIDGVEKQVSSGDTLFIKKGCKHTIKAVTLLQLTEVQLGTDIDAKDKIKHRL